MLNGGILTSIIFFSVVYNVVHASPECTVTNGFDVNKLEGVWRFIAVISPRQLNVNCGRLFFQEESANKFTGYRIGWKNGLLRMSPLNASVHDDKMNLEFETWTKYPMNNMLMKTCNGDSEFALEAPEQKLYLLFSRTRNMSPEFLRKYRGLGQKIGVRLRLMETRNCS